MKICALFVLCFLGFTCAMPGGWTENDANDAVDAGVKTAAEAAIEYYNKVSNSLYYMKIIEILSVRSQVVAGKNYELKVLIGRTDCAKSDVGAKQCDVDENAPQEQCKFRVWVKPYGEVGSVEIISCSKV